MERKDSKIIDLSNATGISDLVAKISSILDEDEYVNKNLFINIGNISLKQSQLLSIKALIEAMNSSLDGIKTTSEMTEASAVGLGISTTPPTQNVMPTFKEAVQNISSAKSELFDEPKSEINSFAQLKKSNSIGDFVSDTSSLPEVEADETLKEETNEFLQNAALEDEIEDETASIPETVQENTVVEVEEENIYEKLSNETSNVSISEDVQSALDITFGESFATQTNEVEEENIITNKSDDNYEKTEVIKDENEGKYILLDTEGITPEGIELIKSNTSDLPTLYLTQTLRSGQTVSYEGNIFIIGDVHPGSEVNATGDVTVWGILGGIVHAGSDGNTDAVVRALKLNPIQLRIANLYSRRNDTINVPYVQRTNEFTPEEARIDRNQIVIYKTLRRED